MPDEPYYEVTPAGRALLDDWPERYSICVYLLCAFVASCAQVNPRPLDESGSTVRAFCPNCKAVAVHEVRLEDHLYSFCLSCEGRSNERRMCDEDAPEGSKPL